MEGQQTTDAATGHPQHSIPPLRRRQTRSPVTWPTDYSPLCGAPASGAGAAAQPAKRHKVKSQGLTHVHCQMQALLPSSTSRAGVAELGPTPSLGHGMARTGPQPAGQFHSLGQDDCNAADAIAAARGQRRAAAQCTLMDNRCHPAGLPPRPGAHHMTCQCHFGEEVMIDEATWATD